MRLLQSFLFFAALAAAQSSQADIFSSKDLQTQAQDLVIKNGTYADKALARYSNHYLLIVKREETGSSELHEHEADIFVAQSGEGSIVTGGKIVGGHTTKAGEIRGSSIEGGERHRIAAGDVIHIPAGTAHQLVLNKGKPFTYFVVKVTGQ